MDKIKVLVVDDHGIVREGISSLLKGEPDIEVIGEAADGLQAIEHVRRLRPDLVLMDISMPGTGGLAATEQIVKQFPGIHVLALTVHEGEEYFFRMLAMGASGYVLKGASSSEMVSAIRAVHSGGTYLHPSVAGKLVDGYLRRPRRGKERDGHATLTPRETEVLLLIGEGKTNQEIAKNLCLSPNTVQTHRTRIMDKLGLHSRPQLIKYAITKGIISPNE